MTNFSGKPLFSKTENAGTGGPQGGGMDSRCNTGVAEVSSTYLAEAAKNAVPMGYKQTEVGVIPEDWEEFGFGSLFQPSVSRKPIKPTSLVSFVGMQDVTEQAQLSTQHLLAIENVKSGFTYFERGDVLVAKITPCFENGKGCHTDTLYTAIGFGSTEFHVLRAADNSDSRFIFYWSNRDVFRKSLESEMVGSAGHRRVPLAAIANYKIPVPPKHEQTAIANALSDVDALISELEKLIAKKQAIKTGTMQQLLTGRTRLPQFALREDGTPKGYKPSELGEIPEDWEIKRLSEISTMHGRIGWQGLKQDEFTFNDRQPFLITGMNFKDGKIRWDEVYHIAEERYEVDKNIQLQIGDILMTKDGTIGKLLFVDHIPKPGKATLNSHLLVFRPKNKCYIPAFLYYLMKTDLLDKHIEINKSGSTFFGITQEAMSKLDVYMPPIEEQVTIATILSDMDEEIQALEQRLGKTRQIKQGIMQELLTGKTRLIKPSKEVIHE